MAFVLNLDVPCALNETGYYRISFDCHYVAVYWRRWVKRVCAHVLLKIKAIQEMLVCSLMQWCTSWETDLSCVNDNHQKGVDRKRKFG